MNQKTIKALAKFSIIIDKEEQKLYDSMKNLKLSHNRKWLLLKEINNKLEFISNNFADESLKYELKKILSKINIELNQNGRVNWGYYK